MPKNKEKLPSILFLSRAYPPITGGIENQNYGIEQALKKVTKVTSFINKKGKKFLPIYAPIALIFALKNMKSHEALLLGDGVLAPIGRLIKLFYPKKKIICIVHGLDITYAKKSSFSGRLYRWINIPALKKMDKIITVGNETITQAVEAGIDRKSCVFIPNGIFPDEIREDHSRRELQDVLGINIENKKVILRVGRYVAHKGVPWFLENVVPKLPPNIVFVAAGGVVGRTVGDHNVWPKSQEIVQKLNLESKVVLLKNLPWSDLKILFNTADLVVSPNIPVHGSMEGFGINAIEAAACGRVVLSSNLEGLKDAITNGENGFLLPPGEPGVWSMKIEEMLSDDAFREQFGQKASEYTRLHYSWPVIAKLYVREIERTTP